MKMGIYKAFFGEKMAITLGNLRNLVLSLTISSYFIPFNLEYFVAIFGIGLGAYYGLKIERETFYSGLNTP